jgi:hypothetical protein
LPSAARSGPELWLEAVVRSVEGYEDEVRALG